MSIFRLFKSQKDGKYVASNRDPVSLCGFQHIQYLSSNIWTINHGNDSSLLNVQVYVNNLLTQPNSIDILDDNTIQITFTTEVNGFANFVIISPEEGCVPYENPIPSPTPSSTVTPTPSVTASPTPSITPSVSASLSATPTPTPTITVTPSASLTPQPSITPTPTPSTSEDGDGGPYYF